MSEDRIDANQYLTLDELQPSVELAASYSFVRDEDYQYRVPGQHLLLVVDGAITGHTPSGRVRAEAGDLLCFPAADLNRYQVHAPCRYYEAHIQLARPPRHRHALWLDGSGPLPLRLRLGAAAERMRSAFDGLCLALGQPGAVYRARVQVQVWDMLAIIAEVVRPARGASAPRIDAWQRARQRLAQDLGSELTVGAMANETGMSVDHFIRGFRRRFGQSPGQFRAEEKLRQAVHRLRSGTEPIKAVAHAFGFSDGYSFTRAVRRYLGVLPSDLRAGRPLAPEAAVADQAILPLNRHIVPPAAGADHFHQFTPRR